MEKQKITKQNLWLFSKCYWSLVILKQLLYLIIVVLAVFLIVETIIRAYVIKHIQIDTWGFNSQGLGDLSPNKDFIALENQKLPYRVVTNSLGLRNNQEINVAKDKNSLRILAIGDSFTFGPYVHNQDAYPAKLEQYLEAKQVTVEVLNAGIPGYTLIDEIEYLKEKGLSLDPDIVLVGVFENDVTDYLPNKRKIFSRRVQKMKSEQWSWILQFIKKSAIVNVLEKKIRKLQVEQVRNNLIQEKGKRDLTEEFQQYFHNLEQLIEILQERKITLWLVFFPAFSQIKEDTYFPQRKIIDQLDKLNKQDVIINLRSSFKNYDRFEALYLMPENGHLSAVGNDLAARIIAERIYEDFSKESFGK